MTEQRVSSRNPFRFLMRVPVPWVFILVYLLGVALESTRHAAISPRAAYLSSLAGATLFAAGALLAGVALSIFYRTRTTTVPGKLSARLVTWGPYRFTRNPMYVGLTLAYLGEAALLNHLWPALLLPLVLLYLHFTVIPVEESRLLQAFPVDYANYRSSVRRWL